MIIFCKRNDIPLNTWMQYKFKFIKNQNNESTK